MGAPRASSHRRTAPRRRGMTMMAIRHARARRCAWDRHSGSRADTTPCKSRKANDTSDRIARIEETSQGRRRPARPESCQSCNPVCCSLSSRASARALLEAGTTQRRALRAPRPRRNGNSDSFIFFSASFCAVRAPCVPPFRVAQSQPATMTSQKVLRRCRSSG